MVLGLSVLWGCGGNKPTPNKGGQGPFPPNFQVACPVTQDVFNSWFASGKATENGFVLPANSLAFTPKSNCDFYTWSEQMFLWITSPTSGSKGYDGGKTVMESPVFYDVSPVNSAGNRTITQHTAGKPIRLFSTIRQTGPNNLPVIMDKKGRLFEVESHVMLAKEKLMMRAATGNPDQVAHVVADANGAPQFKNAAGATLERPKAMPIHKVNPGRIVQEFVVEGTNKHIYIDTGGNQVATEAGQATGNVLMAQNGSLVYYISMVNDVYAYFLTGGKNNVFADTLFPTTQGELSNITKYAAAAGVTLVDSNALAMELKTSWVEAKSLPDVSSYITIDAVIPVYDTTNQYQWVQKGEKTTKLALVGMHVVGSTLAHPEMIWATFEHEKNAPNAAYFYTDTAGNQQRVAQDAGKGWLFSANASDPNPNLSFMKNPTGETIDTVSPHTISASNTLRVHPWGADSNVIPNPGVASDAASNSEVISVNSAVVNMLVGKDVRKHYLCIGATWTGGAAPSGLSYPADKTTAGAVGTSVLANSTMETDFQSNATSCLTCHSGTLNPNTPFGLSHIFSDILPLSLPKAPGTIKK